jgi:pyridoxine 4-dehydrogenase
MQRLSSRGFAKNPYTTLSSVADQLGAKLMQVALAWLLHRSPKILSIHGTSSLTHLRENLAAGQLTLSPQTLAELDGIAAATVEVKHRLQQALRSTTGVRPGAAD